MLLNLLLPDVDDGRALTVSTGADSSGSEAAATFAFALSKITLRQNNDNSGLTYTNFEWLVLFFFSMRRVNRRYF